MSVQPRRRVPIETSVAVYFRDGWLCSLCGRPTVFHLALKFAGLWVERELPGVQLAYFTETGAWRRDASPLLDDLGACVDHVEAHAKGGPHELANFATACAKCNSRKSAREKADYLRANPIRKVKSKYGEPTKWDGLSSLFVACARENVAPLTVTERKWLRVLEPYVGAG